MAPTERTAFYHGQRVHVQIITWKVLDNTEIQLMPDEWDGIGEAINYSQL